jgi:CRISPR-associated protein Cas1
LYVSDPEVLICKSGDRILVRKKGEVVQDIPAFHIGQVVLFGNPRISTPAIHFFLTHGIEVSYLSGGGSYRGRLQPGITGNAELRRRLYERASDPGFCIDMARRIVVSKVQAQLALCRRRLRDHGESMAGRPLEVLSRIGSQIPRAARIETLLGLEGAASAAYFRMFRAFLNHGFGFQARVPRPAPDPVNSMLSLGYTLLYNRFFSMIHGAGLDPYLGFFHQAKKGHACLASDLMEEFRPVIVDSIVLMAVNKKAVTPDQFVPAQRGIRFRPGALPRFLSLFEQRLSDSLWFDPLHRKVPYRACLEFQVRRMARTIAGKEGTYISFHEGRRPREEAGA